MKPLTFENLEKILATQTATVEFPALDTSVTVRQLTAEETKRIADATAGKDADCPMTEAEAQVLMASIAITSDNYDSDDGRAKLRQLPRTMMHLIANAIFGLSGADGSTKKN